MRLPGVLAGRVARHRGAAIRDDSDDAALLAAKPAREAFDVFYRRHHGYVLAVAAKRVGDLDAAFDIAAETFAAAYLNRRRFDPARGNARSWLAGIARYKAFDHHRSERAATAARRRLGLERHPPTDAALEEAQALIAAEELVAHLSDGERSAIWGRVVEDRGYDDLATEAGVPNATIRKRASTGLARLRKARA